MRPFESNHFAGWSAYLSAAATIIGFITLILFFSEGQPFGTINDTASIFIALAILPGFFALYKLERGSNPMLSLGALVVGSVAALIAAFLQTLLVFKVISSEQSGEIVTIAFGVFGISLAVFNYLAYSNKSFSAQLAIWGLVAGAGYAIVTLGFGEIIRLLANNLTGFTNGSQGLYNLDKPSLFGFILKSGTNFYYLIFVLVLIIFFVVNRLDRSRIGRAWIAIREDEDVAQMMGVNTTFYKLLAFAIGALIGGLGGSVFAAWQGSIFPDNFNLFVSINVLCLIIIGGMGSIPGVIIGSFALIALPDILREFATYRLLIFGLLLVIMMIARPEGFIPSRRRQLELHSKSNGDQTISSDIPGEEA